MSIGNMTSEFQSLTSVIIANAPGRLVQSHSSIPNVIVATDAAVFRLMAIVVNGQYLTYTTETLSDPPALSYTKTRDQLVKDWETCLFIIIDGIGIPICYWQRLYSRTRPNGWKSIKDQWTKHKVHCGWL